MGASTCVINHNNEEKRECYTDAKKELEWKSKKNRGEEDRPTRVFKLWHISLWRTNVISHILLCFVLHAITDLSTDKPARTLFGYGRVTRLGGETGQSRPNRASNV
jgi:hypothetical protein